MAFQFLSPTIHGILFGLETIAESWQTKQLGSRKMMKLKS